ncbi:hemin-degrading factor [Martelella alba]|uniref:Hemin-degrading factor n=1 Tax=Martelella alba TaxID=2590451 RepID=A0ABY2SLJ7_9HYPH|nr:ChuX/HutX family heme-like substrate-binding protein [Martelella alba]TKI06602.1 hemin-degrading factor [Martelella alba]
MHADYEMYLRLKTRHPKKYARDLAALLHVSEAELASLRVGHDACRLRMDAPALLHALESVGEIKSITRNSYAVHEQVGYFRNLRLGEHSGLALNPRGLDLRLFTDHWRFAFALSETAGTMQRRSIQVFDRQGDAVIKVYTTERTELPAWENLIATFTETANPFPVPSAQPLTATHVQAPPQLEREWRAMTDVHQFAGLLKNHQLTRQQAFRAVPEDLARQVDNDALPLLLEKARLDGNEIMIFVGNRGCIQIFTGIIEKVTPWENWLNIFNREFTLHVMRDTIEESWVTRKPTRDGFVTSLELFAADGTQILQMFGRRNEGEQEQTRWRSQIDALPVAGGVTL